MTTARTTLTSLEKALLAHGRRLGLAFATELLRAELAEQAKHSNRPRQPAAPAMRQLQPGPGGYIVK